MKNTVIAALSVLIAALSVLIAACGGDDGDSDSGGGEAAYKEQPVSYSVDPVNGPTCRRHSDESEYISGNYHSITCVWYCGTGEGYRKQYVSIEFEKSRFTGGKWIKDRVYASDGICR